jgi:hypothetical protein
LERRRIATDRSIPGARANVAFGTSRPRDRRADHPPLPLARPRRLSRPRLSRASPSPRAAPSTRTRAARR